MRPRSLLGAFLLTAPIHAALMGMACSTGSSQPQGPADGATSSDAAATGSAGAVASGDAAPPTAVGQTGEITNSPPSGGVVMDNATPPGSSGVTTRLQPIVDVMAANLEQFRACFDVWGQTNPGRELKVMLSIKLDKAGALTSAGLKPDETDVVDEPMETCMANVAKSLEFPASPSGQGTRYNHRFVFKAKKS